MHPLLRTLTWNCVTSNPYLKLRNPSETYLEPRNFLEPLRGTLTWIFGIFRNLTLTWNPLLEPSLGTPTRNLLEPLLGTLEPPGYFPSNPSLEPFGTFPWNDGTFWNLHLEPLVAWKLHLKPFTWNLGTSWILYLARFLEPWNLPKPLLGALVLGTLEPPGFFTLEPLLGTSEPFGEEAKDKHPWQVLRHNSVSHVLLIEQNQVMLITSPCKGSSCHQQNTTGGTTKICRQPPELPLSYQVVFFVDQIARCHQRGRRPTSNNSCSRSPQDSFEPISTTSKRFGLGGW